MVDARTAEGTARKSFPPAEQNKGFPPCTSSCSLPYNLMSSLFFQSEATRLQRRVETLQLFEDFFSRTLRLVGFILALWMLFSLSAHAGPLDWLSPEKAAAKINTIENIAYAVGGAVAMLAALFILRKAAIIISRHWKLTLCLCAIVATVGGILL